MGSFRSQPDLVKHTTLNSGPGFNYAVTHMCGKKASTQDGESTWRMHISPNQNYPKRSMRFSEYSMDTVVQQC